MAEPAPIPVFALFGETAPFPDIVHVERISDRAPAHGWRIPPHRHGNLAQLLLIEDGAAEARVDGRDLTLSKGDFLFVPAHSVHGYAFRPGTAGWVLSLPSALVAAGGARRPGLAAALRRATGGPAGDRLVRLAGLLAEGSAETGRFRTELVLGLSGALLAALAGRAAELAPAAAPRRNPRLAGFDALIAAHMAEGWSVADYAAALSVSTGHLSRLCRHAGGLGAKAYLDQAVMEEACRLLAFTRLPVADIGYRLGFDDPSHFSKRFRAARAEAPTDYRRRVQGEATAPA